MIYLAYLSFFYIHLESFGVEKINKFIQYRGSLENHTQFYTVMGKTAEKPHPSRWPHTHIWGVLPTPGRVLCKLGSSSQSVLYREWVIISVKKLLSQ